MLNHPALPQAVGRLAQGMLDLSARDRALDGVFKDAGRYTAAMCCFYLDASGRLTLPALKALSAKSGLLSPGRARAMVQFLLHLGYLVPVSGRSRGAVVYAPTPAFRAAWRTHFLAALDAAARLDPGVGALQAMLHEPQVLAAFSRNHTDCLLEIIGGAGAPSTFFTAFLHPHAGTQIVWTLLAGSVGGGFPPRTGGRISLSAVARRFGVSRIHVRRIFERAGEAGLATLSRDGVVTFSEDAQMQLRLLYGAQLTQLLAATSRTLAEVA